jgi:hypothetical protein
MSRFYRYSVPNGTENSDKRTKGNFYHLIDQWNTIIRSRNRMFARMSARFDKILYPKNADTKIALRK